MNSRQNKAWIGGVLLLISQACWSTVFDLTPLGNLPSGVVPGETVYAYYIVYNKSTENLANNRLILPKNVVTQSTIPEPKPSTVTLCEAEPFYLGSKQSCVLKLAVTGAVNGDSEDSSQQIYVCLQDGLNCSGTSINFNNTLNVENKNLQTAYVADQTYNTTGGVAACPVLNDGSLGTIASDKCSYANINFSAPTDVIVNNDAIPPVAYVANFSDGTNGYISVCTLGQRGAVMQLESCSSVTDEKIFAPVGLRLTPDSSRLYITNNKAGSDSVGYPFQSAVIFCDVNKNGSLNLPCQEVLGSVFNAPGSTWIAGNYAYVINNDFIATVSICPMQTDNTFANCKSYQYTDSSVGVDIIVNEEAAKAYIAHASAPDNKIFVCDVNITAGTLSNCNAFTDSNFTYFESAGLQLSPDNQWLYVTNNYDSGNSITVCGINADGSLSSPCKLATDASAGLNIPAGRIAFKLIGNTYYAYIANRGGVTITYCEYDPTTGTLGLDGGCNFSGYVTNGTSVAIQGNSLYAAQIYDLSYIFTIAICPIQNDGSLGLCQLSDGEGKITQGFYTANFWVQNNIAYVPNNKAQKIVFCGTSGNTLTNCSTLIQPLPNGRMTFANFNGTNYVYFANNIATFNSPFSAGSIYKCAVQANGMFTGCQELVLGLGVNFYFGGFDLNAAQNLLYATGAYTNPTGNFPAAIFALDSFGDITATEIFTRPGSLFDTGYLSNILMSNPNNMAYFPLNATLSPLFVAFCSQDDLDGCVYYTPPPPPYFIEPMSVWTQRFAL